MSKSKILVIDDEEDFAFFLKANLEARGQYTVKVANSGADWLDIAGQWRPHLIVLDIIMPGMDGFEVLRQLKEGERTMTVPVLMLTARHDDESKVAAAGLYCEGYFAKPVKIDDLHARIRKILDMRDVK